MTLYALLYGELVAVTNKDLFTTEDYYQAIMEGAEGCSVPEGFEEFAKEIPEMPQQEQCGPYHIGAQGSFERRR